jgi:N-acetyl-beta-hexosaminidase
MTFLKTCNTAEHDRNQPVETEPEAAISDFVRRDVVSNPGRQPENQSQLVASNINSLLQRTTAISVQEIDKLITELQTLSDMLHNESSRVQREIVQYSTFTQATLRSTKIIAESLEQWRKAPDAQTLSD